MSNHLNKLAWMVILALLLVNPPVLAEGHEKPKGKISQLSDIQQASSRIQQWLAQSVIQVAGVNLQTTDKGVEVILETNQSDQLQLTNQSEGNSFIINISNAQLNLPSGDTSFRLEKPMAGITEVKVSNLDANTIRVTITGETAAPQVELFDADQGLIFSVITTASTSETQPEEPIELLVIGQQNRYRVRNAATGTRTDTLIRDIPQTIQVVPEQVIKDQRVTRLRDALLNVGGVVQNGGFGGGVDQLATRGFFNGGLFGGGILVDGFKDGRNGIRETANVERLEVLKGPASVLYGGVEPGGVINLVTKQPLKDPYYNAELSVGNFSTFRPSLDISGPLNSDRTLLYRLNSVYESSAGFRDFNQDIQRFFISPTLKWEIGKATNLRLQFDYLNDERPFDRGFLAFGNGILDIPVERILGEPDDVRKVEEIGFSYRLEHNFNDNWKIRNAFRYQSADTFDYRAEPVRLDETTGILTRNFRSNDDYQENYTLQTDLVGKLATGSIDHTLLFGVDLARATSGGTQSRLPGGITPSIDVFNPVYNAIPRPGLEELTNVVRNNQNRSTGLGIFVQDQVAFADNLKLVVGGRLDFVDQNSKDLRDGSESNQYDTAITPRLGIVYQPIQPISLYTSYSQSFSPNFATSVDGTILEPERGTQYEVGVKGEFLDGKLAATLAAYDIIKSNMATTDPANPDFSIPIGKQRSQGVELNVGGEISPGWNVIASYSYVDAKYTEFNDGYAGNRPVNIPFNTASLWTTYQLQRGNLQGLGFGLGLFYIGDRQGNDENTYVIPGYLRTDAAIYYQRDNWRSGVNIQNLFNEKYFHGANFGRVAIEPGAPLRVIGSFSVTF
ncbi:TonB-dependent siderophore receptor [Anabaenopsis tanganyikae CS-531]|uniref:TonB-dependent siderophore receptor n=1 Tax=Anabaenopsis tanganyikae CS-531 TaxID=2785304 RepID=A0ABT6KH04_9CYAN|nr:TonB-dependent siderophore receptor [Anabaenopsis tanganyikae]MDH6106644.1 TonB-dependent siderophore receptor [Anabaenopsis tanganyikae CS-531]